MHFPLLGSEESAQGCMDMMRRERKREREGKRRGEEIVITLKYPPEGSKNLRTETENK